MFCAQTLEMIYVFFRWHLEGETLKTIVSHTKFSRRTVKWALTYFQKRGLVERQKVSPPGRRSYYGWKWAHLIGTPLPSGGAIELREIWLADMPGSDAPDQLLPEVAIKSKSQNDQNMSKFHPVSKPGGAGAA